MKNLREFGFPVEEFDRMLREERWEDLLYLVTVHYNRVKHKFTLVERAVIRFRLTNIRFSCWLLRWIKRINAEQL